MGTGRLRVLMASYGGGHAAMLGPVAQELRTCGVDVDLMGFTTGRAALERAGLEAGSVTRLLDPDPGADEPYRRAVQALGPLGSHPDVRPEESEAYFTVGLRDLAERVGLEQALLRVAEEGRTAFTPVSVMARYIARSRPDLVVSTTSPRFELAMLRAARQEGVTSVALGDLFLIDERRWILSGDYAEHLTVISPVVAEALKHDGLSGTETHVTGNPAFDLMQPKPTDDLRRSELRRRLGVEGRTVILWPAAQLGAVANDQRPYASPDQVVHAMEQICRLDPEFTYILRPHPNAPFSLPAGAVHGILDHGLLSAEEVLLLADLVCVEVSTMGLQAALLGKPVICVAFAHEAGFPLYGLAQAVETLSEMVEVVVGRRYGPPSQAFAMPPLGSATRNIARLLMGLVRRAPL